MSDRTDAEQRVIDSVAERKGREYAEEHAAAIIAQTQVKGEVPSLRAILSRRTTWPIWWTSDDGEEYTSLSPIH